MQQLAQRLSPILRLTRVTAAFAVVGNAWFVVLWTRAFENEPGHAALASGSLWLQLIGAAASALGLFSFGASLNDLLDLRRDRWLHPERPLPSGRASVETAVGVVAGTLMLAILGATVFGTRSVVITLLLAAGVLIFNGAARFVPAFGAIAYGLLFAGQMLTPNPDLAFMWPVWLVFTQASAVYGACHVLAGKSPAFSTRAWVASALGYAVWTSVFMWLNWRRASGEGVQWSPGIAAIAPIVLVALFAILSVRKVRSLGQGQRAADKVGRYGTTWMSLYVVGWMAGAGRTAEAIGLGVLALLGYLGMATLREVYSLAEHPAGYRRV